MGNLILPAFVALVPFNTTLAAQVEPPAVLWDRTFPNGACCRAIRETSDGDLVVAGSLGYADALYIMKTDSEGNPRWDRTFRLSESWNLGISMCIGLDGSYTIGGTSSNGSSFDLALFNISGAGDLTWRRMYGETEVPEIGGAVALAVDGGYFVVGYDASGYVVRTDGSGNTVWEKRFVSNLWPNAPGKLYSVASTPDGGCAVAGTVFSPVPEASAYLAKLDRDGGVTWEQSLPCSPDAGRLVEATSICQTKDGGFVVGGKPVGKVNAQGQIVWRMCADRWIGTMSIEQTADGGYITAGFTFGLPGAGWWRCWPGPGWVTKLNEEGDVVWQRDFEPGASEAVVQTKDGGYVVVGGGNQNELRITKLAPESPPAPFRRGRTNGDDAVNVADAVCLLGYLFAPAGDPCKQTVAQCLDAGDTNDDGRVNISDAIMLLRHVFGGHTLPAPFAACGTDESSDALHCVTFVGCD